MIQELQPEQMPTFSSLDDLPTKEELDKMTDEELFEEVCN